MEGKEEAIQIKPELKEEYILPLVGSGSDTENIITAKKEEGNFIEEKFDADTKPTVTYSLVRRSSELDLKNNQCDEVKNSPKEVKNLEESIKNDYSIVEMSNEAEAGSEKIIEDVLVEIVESDDLQGSQLGAEKTLCNGSFETEDSSMEHTDNSALDSNDKCNNGEETLKCEDSSVQPTKKAHRQTQGQKYCCKICGMEFKYKANCRKHEKLHDDIYRFTCKYCNISFKQTLTLKNHYIYVHETEKPYKCEDCDSAFKSMNNLKAHIEVHHNTGETFTCDFCPMEFKRKCYLKRHIGVHTNPDKKFTCDDCGLKCRSKTDIAKHVLTHIGAVEKRFFCEICGTGFSKQAHVVRHTRTHFVEKCFPCELCDKAYKDQYSLKTHHETVHLGITYSCEVCGFQSDRYSLKKHLRRCGAPKKFTCEVCQKVYYLKKWFEQHVKSHSIQS